MAQSHFQFVQAAILACLIIVVGCTRADREPVKAHYPEAKMEFSEFREKADSDLEKNRQEIKDLEDWSKSATDENQNLVESEVFKLHDIERKITAKIRQLDEASGQDLEKVKADIQALLTDLKKKIDYLEDLREKN